MAVRRKIFITPQEMAPTVVPFFSVSGAIANESLQSGSKVEE